MSEEEPHLLQKAMGGDPEDPLYPWRVIIVSVMLQRTSYKQARPALEVIFREWPTPGALAAAHEDHLTEVVRPCGFSTQRVKNLKGISESYVLWLLDYDPEPAEGIRVPGPRPEVARIWKGVGKYVEDAVRIVVWNDMSIEPEDKKLHEYWEWARDEA